MRDHGAFIGRIVVCDGVRCINLPRDPRGVLCKTSLTTDSRSDHVRLPVARPLWIPAFAGMTVVRHSNRRGEIPRCARNDMGARWVNGLRRGERVARGDNEFRGVKGLR